MSDSEDEVEETVRHQKMGVDTLAAKRAHLVQEYTPYVSQEKIAQTATAIYFDVMDDATSKRMKRRAMMAKCAYEAYILNGIPKDPVLLAKKFEVDRKKFMEAQDIFYSMLFNKKALKLYPKVHLTAKQLLPDISRHFGFSDLPFEDLNVIIDEMYASSAFLTRWAPRDIAIVLFLWYMDQVGCVNSSGTVVSKQHVQIETQIANTKIKDMMPLILKIMKPN